uniref:Uncharacterized protein n=1 Tax=Pygocentrus nattereri TaxID=42514 RepID=A0AAR2L4B9_PYGNA
MCGHESTDIHNKQLIKHVKHFTQSPASPDLAKELAALKSDIIQAVTSELTHALTAEFHSISRDYHSKLQTELQEMKSELLRDNASLRAELGSVVRTVSEVETSLSALSDEVVGLRARVESLSSELVRVDWFCLPAPGMPAETQRFHRTGDPLSGSSP